MKESEKAFLRAMLSTIETRSKEGGFHFPLNKNTNIEEASNQFKPIAAELIKRGFAVSGMLDFGAPSNFEVFICWDFSMIKKATELGYTMYHDSKSAPMIDVVRRVEGATFYAGKISSTQCELAPDIPSFPDMSPASPTFDYMPWKIPNRSEPTRPEKIG